MNPYIISAAIAALGLTNWYSYDMGRKHMRNEIEAQESKVEKAIAITREQARLGAADAMAKLTVVHKTIQGRVEREIQTNTVYRDCVHTDASLRDINAALRGPKDLAGSGLQLPATGGAAGPVLRSDDPKAP
jgi:hypothetical protein